MSKLNMTVKIEGLDELRALVKELKDSPHHKLVVNPSKKDLSDLTTKDLVDALQRCLIHEYPYHVTWPYFEELYDRLQAQGLLE